MLRDRTNLYAILVIAVLLVVVVWHLAHMVDLMGGVGEEGRVSALLYDCNGLEIRYTITPAFCHAYNVTVTLVNKGDSPLVFYTGGPYCDNRTAYPLDPTPRIEAINGSAIIITPDKCQLAMIKKTLPPGASYNTTYTVLVSPSPDFNGYLVVSIAVETPGCPETIEARIPINSND